jgi:hypothetical protein
LLCRCRTGLTSSLVIEEVFASWNFDFCVSGGKSIHFENLFKRITEIQILVLRRSLVVLACSISISDIYLSGGEIDVILEVPFAGVEIIVRGTDQVKVSILIAEDIFVFMGMSGVGIEGLCDDQGIVFDVHVQVRHFFIDAAIALVLPDHGLIFFP